MMCFLAFMMERKLERLLPAPSEKEAPNSPERIREALLSMRLAKITTNGETLYLKAKNASLGTKIFKAVGVNLPKNVSRESELQAALDITPETYNGQISMF